MIGLRLMGVIVKLYRRLFFLGLLLVSQNSELAVVPTPKSSHPDQQFKTALVEFLRDPEVESFENLYKLKIALYVLSLEEMEEALATHIRPGKVYPDDFGKWIKRLKQKSPWRNFDFERFFPQGAKKAIQEFELVSAKTESKPESPTFEGLRQLIIRLEKMPLIELLESTELTTFLYRLRQNKDGSLRPLSERALGLLRKFANSGAEDRRIYSRRILVEHGVPENKIPFLTAEERKLGNSRYWVPKCVKVYAEQPKRE